MTKKGENIIRCRLCSSQKLLTVLNFGEHPIAHNFLDSQSQDECCYQVVLNFCENCGLAQLSDPIAPDLLYTNYVTLSSWKYQPHIPRLIEVIEELTNLQKDSKILEVGSNDGIFLDALSKRGYNNVVGIEPARDAYCASKDKGINTINSYFDKKIAEEFVARHGRCDLFISRQMLEHIQDIDVFKDAMKTVLSPGGFVLFELPEFTCNLDTPDYTLWEEHVNYFTPQTLDYFLVTNKIKTIHSETVLFSGESFFVLGQYLEDDVLIPNEQYIDKLRLKIINYRKNWPVFCNKFIRYLSEYKEKGSKIAVYGAGARLCSLINFAGLTSYIEFIVDDQPQKQGKYMPGSKLPILPSIALEENGIDLCLLAVNTESEDKVIAKHKQFVDRGGIFVSVLPPSNRLPLFWKEMSSKEKVGVNYAGK